MSTPTTIEIDQEWTDSFYKLESMAHEYAYQHTGTDAARRLQQEWGKSADCLRKKMPKMPKVTDEFGLERWNSVWVPFFQLFENTGA